MTNERGQDANRAMALALRVGELLLSSGESTEYVDKAMRTVATAHGLRHCEADVNLSVLTLSSVPGDGRPPLTGQRRVRRRQPDYARLVAVQALVKEISAGGFTPEETRERLREIVSRPPIYPTWLVVISLALIASFASFLVGGGALAALAAFVGTVLGDRASAWLARQGIAEFFQLTVAAVFGSLVAVVLVALHVPVAPSAAVVGAVIALLPGRSFVACAQDGIAGEYVTATGRLAEIVFIMAAVISGIGITISLSIAMDVPIQVESAPIAPLSLSPGQLIGAAGVSLTFAVALMTPRRHLIAATIGGGVVWSSYVTLAVHGVPWLMSTAVASASVGLLGAFYTARYGVPSLVVVVPAICPLLPGTALYRAMLEITHVELNSGIITLVQAASTALALGAGVILGTEIPHLFVHDLAGRFRRAARRTR